MANGSAAIGHLLATADSKWQKKFENVKKIEDSNPPSHICCVNTARKTTLRQFCTVLFCNVDRDLSSYLHVDSGYERFDDYFSGVSVSVDSFQKFLTGCLAKSFIDDRFYGHIEKLVWDLIKFDFDKFSSRENNIIRLVKIIKKHGHHYKLPFSSTRRLFFMIFCLFNRFCDTKEIPMTISGETANFILAEIGEHS